MEVGCGSHGTRDVFATTMQGIVEELKAKLKAEEARSNKADAAAAAAAAALPAAQGQVMRLERLTHDGGAAPSL